MNSSNIDQFNEATVAILAHLYQAFPSPTDICSIVIGIETPDLLRDRVTGEYQRGGFDALSGEEQKQVKLLFDTAIWLARTGLIHYEKKGPFELYYVTLTLQGLALLKATPESLKAGPSLGEQLVGASKSGVKEVLRSVVGEVISLGARIGAGQLSLPP